VEAANLLFPGEGPAGVVGDYSFVGEELNYGVDVCGVVCRNVDPDRPGRVRRYSSVMSNRGERGASGVPVDSRATN